MWIRQDLVNSLSAASMGANLEESKRFAEASKKIEEAGRAVCQHCKEDIVKNNEMPGGGWTWESEFLVGFCDKAGNTRKHSPLIDRGPETNVQPP